MDFNGIGDLNINKMMGAVSLLSSSIQDIKHRNPNISDIEILSIIKLAIFSKVLQDNAIALDYSKLSKSFKNEILDQIQAVKTWTNEDISYALLILLSLEVKR